jgi:hypothetical protein
MRQVLPVVPAKHNPHYLIWDEVPTMVEIAIFKQVKCMHNITHSELDKWNAMYMLSGYELIDTEYISLLRQNMKFIFCRAG